MRLSIRSPEGQNALLNTVVQPLWDEALVGTGSATADINLFVTGTATRSLTQTNLGLPGQISAPDHFILRGFMIAPLPPACAVAGFVEGNITNAQVFADWQRFLLQAQFRFTVGSAQSPIVYGHPALFPCGIGVDGFIIAGGATTTNYFAVGGNGQRLLENRYSLGQDYAELLRAGEQFRGVYQFPVALSFSVSFTARTYLTGFWSQGVH